MTITRILNGLEAMDLTGADAVQAARLGFLEWAFCDLNGGTAQAAREALESVATQRADSAAARAFVSYLHEATHALSRPTRRRSRLVH